MVYLDPEQRKKVEVFAKLNEISMSQMAREAFGMRMTVNDDRYKVGFNEGMAMAAKIAKTTEGAKMMFPSGKSFGDLVSDAIVKQMKKGEFQ
jgi:hypothetical protein